MIVPIKHILNENGVKEIFKLIIPNGNYEGEYVIEKPDGWNEIDSIININEEFLNVEDFIIGDNTKIKFSQFSNPKAFSLIRNVYLEQGGDGRIIFKWIAVKNGIEYDLLSENFEINLNKKSESFDKTRMMTEVELIKSEAQNKLYTREDTTVDIFEEKDLDGNNLDPITFFTLGYKKGDKTLTNFYSYDISQFELVTADRKDHFFSFARSSDYEFGNNNNDFAGYKNNPYERIDQGPFVSANINLKSMKIAISNMDVAFKRDGGGYPNVGLFAVIRNGGTEVFRQKLKDSYVTPFPDETRITIDYEEFNLQQNLAPGQNLIFMFFSNDNTDFNMFLVETHDVSIRISADMESPLVRTSGVRLITALNQLVKNYSGGEIEVESTILSEGGAFHNTSISTGMYLRGLPPIYLLKKIKTSFKGLFNDGCSNLMALGFDVNTNKLIIESIDYFFKDVQVYDLSTKQYLTEGFKMNNDSNIGYNSLLFGSKKYSTNVKFDIKNFNTSLEINTPIKSNKGKFDKQTNCIIDPYKIQELIEDSSTATNDNDDDLILVDLVQVNDHWDEGVFSDCTHIIEGGKLVLKCASIPFDTTLIEVGQEIIITEGLNAGNWIVLSIDGLKMEVNKTSGIEEGTSDTRITYKIDSLIKNRTTEGFTNYNDTIRNPESTTNIRHNPKYQMARWWPLFGSGLRKKINTELLKVTSYKNNSAAQMMINSSDMANELQGEVIVGGNEELSRMRDYKPTFFNGESIEISFKISFEEFLIIYNNWKFGMDGLREYSRGYITCNTPYGIYDIYPFGPSAFSHNKAKNILSIKGKVKGKSIENPIILSVVQVDKNTVTLTWDYVVEYVNPSIKIQYSLDGSNWETVHTVNNVKTATFSSSVFDEIMTGETVYFRVSVTTADFYNKVSNSLWVIWQFNDWAIKEISRTENVNCGYSYLTFEIKGTVNLEINWQFFCFPEGGECYVTDLSDNSTVVSFAPPYPGDQTTTLSLVNETKQFYVVLKNSNKTDTGIVLSCTFGNLTYLVDASIVIEITDLATNLVTYQGLNAYTTKRYRGNPIDIP